jgi:hypothetical protein
MPAFRMTQGLWQVDVCSGQGEKWRPGQMTSAINPNTVIERGLQQGRFARASHQLQPLQTRVPVLADDDVVVHGNAERLCDLDNRLGHVDVGLRRRRIAGGVVVHETNTASMLLNIRPFLRAERR